MLRWCRDDVWPDWAKFFNGEIVRLSAGLPPFDEGAPFLSEDNASGYGWAKIVNSAVPSYDASTQHIGSFSVAMVAGAPSASFEIADGARAFGASSAPFFTF